MIISKTPFRISFFGGGTDYPSWSSKNGGTVLSTTIDKYCYISCRYLPPFFDHKYRIVYSQIENVKDINDIKHPAVKAVLNSMECYQGLEIHYDGDLPARSGLGTSSSFTVGLLHTLWALRGSYVSKQALARQAIYVEQKIIGEHVGSQDQVAASFGGLNKIEFSHDGGFNVESVILPENRKEELQGHLMLFFTGLQRNAAEIAKSKIANLEERRVELKSLREMVLQALDILQNETNNIEQFGELLDQSWQLKRSLSDQVSNVYIDQLYHLALKAGAIGGKLLGAGGGGFLLLFVRPSQQDNVRQALKSLIQVPVKFEEGGAKIVLYQPNGLS